MLIDFNQTDVTVLKNFNGGEKEFRAKMITDKNNRILFGRLIPGASIGMHTHETSSEIIYVLEGSGKMLYDDGEERLVPGLCHYCEKGHRHSFINDGEEDLCFFAVVPQHK
ncbi:MAG: cupin domain-containing protein [Clostridia bacterium]|nr:cupin domain-containing protein [Clostridia bacterium]